MTAAVISGTFDPFTRGHEDIVLKASKMFKTVIILIGNNPSKVPVFNRTVRKSLIEDQIWYIKNVRVEIATQPLLVQDVKNLNASVIVRGIRTASDVDYEDTMMMINRNLAPDVETVYIKSSPELAHISSSVFKELLTLDRNGEWMVGDTIFDRYATALYGKYND